MPHYLYLAIAIIAEVSGTLALRASESFTRLGPSLIVVIGYGLAFYCLSLTLKHIPVGIAYAIWSGAGIVLIAAFGSSALFGVSHLSNPGSRPLAAVNITLVGLLLEIDVYLHVDQRILLNVDLLRPVDVAFTPQSGRSVVVRRPVGAVAVTRRRNDTYVHTE
jgi:multidrug transporter EmrE-like cation transporter